VTSEQKKWAWVALVSLTFLAGIVLLAANTSPPTAAEQREQERDTRIVPSDLAVLRATGSRRDRMLGVTPVIIEPPAGSAGGE
jgi:hypothetical protein